MIFSLDVKYVGLVALSQENPLDQVPSPARRQGKETSARAMRRRSGFCSSTPMKCVYFEAMLRLVFK
jgi:hypothetical protein